MRFETKAIHAGLDIDNHSGSVVPPITPSTIYEIDPEGRKDSDYLYTRLGNPNRKQLEHLIAELEGGEASAVFSSGIAAALAVLQSLSPGDHILVPEDVYAGNRKMMKGIMEPWGLKIDFIDITSLDQLEKFARPETRLVWIETPSNPLLRITDLEAVIGWAKSRNILTCVDNTWPTPVNLRPFEFGADYIVHSSTKYFGGHSDLLGGAVAAREESDHFEKIRFIQKMGGAVPSPQDCWMLSRSIRTLAYRMRGHNEHAAQIAEFLKSHPKIESVFYPGLPEHLGHEIAKKQMRGFGGMISFLIVGGEKDAIRITSKAKIIKRATSLGGVESTWEYRRATEGPESVAPENLIRLSVGLEHPEDLIEDISQALG